MNAAEFYNRLTANFNIIRTPSKAYVNHTGIEYRHRTVEAFGATEEEAIQGLWEKIEHLAELPKPLPPDDSLIQISPMAHYEPRLNIPIMLLRRPLDTVIYQPFHLSDQDLEECCMTREEEQAENIKRIKDPYRVTVRFSIVNEIIPMRETFFLDRTEAEPQLFGWPPSSDLERAKNE